MTFLLDTDVYSLYLLDKYPVIARKLHAAQAQGHRVLISVVTQCEVYRGRIDALLKAASGEQLLRAQWNFMETERMVSEIEKAPFDTDALAIFDRLRVERGIKRIGRADLLIGCIALAQRATLVTRNMKDFRQIKGLSLDNWAKE